MTVTIHNIRTKVIKNIYMPVVIT